MLLNLDNTFTFNGHSVAWGSIGKGDPVVMVHGFPWSAQSWRKIVPWLARKYSVYYYDMLGCGGSQKPDTGDVSAAIQNELLAALIKNWGLDCPSVVAHDFGGLAALRGYYLNELRYRSLTLIDVVAVLPSGSPFFRHVHEHEHVFATLPAYAHEALFNAYIQAAAYKKLNQTTQDMYASPWTGEVGQAAFYRQIAQSDTSHIQQLQSLYKPMQCKVNMIWAEDDSFIPISQGKALARLIAADNFACVPQAGHLIQEDAPEAVMANLLLN